MRRGFTLIELLVVIAIISLLSSVVLASLNTARERARDSRRMVDLKQLQVALELYASDHDGEYPNTTNRWWGNCSYYGSHPTSGANGYIPGLAPTYIPQLPLDPNATAPSRCYLYRSTGVDYMVLVQLTVETYAGSNNPMPRPLYPTYPSFAVYTPGAAMW